MPQRHRPARYDYTGPRGQLNVGWAGGVGHIDRARPLAALVAAMMRGPPDVRFDTVGSAVRATSSSASSAPSGRCAPVPPLETYAASLTTSTSRWRRRASNNLFRGKSDLRWLEASALGDPAVGDPEAYPEIETASPASRRRRRPRWPRRALRLVDDPATREPRRRRRPRARARAPPVVAAARAWARPSLTPARAPRRPRRGRPDPRRPHPSPGALPWPSRFPPA